jgi:WD40 repeat protein
VLLPDIKHQGPVLGAVFDKAESRILSWSQDGTVRLWDAATGEPCGAPTKHEGAVLGAVFDKAEARILCGRRTGPSGCGVRQPASRVARR